MEKSVIIIPCLKDNYSYLLHSEDAVIAIDPAEEEKIIDRLEETSLPLNYLLCTHHHTDHMAGAYGLKKKTGCKMWGPDERIPELDRVVRGGEKLKMGSIILEVIDTPGHTDKSVCYYWKKGKTLFTGDVLFGGGCGRIFEGTPEQMFSSLKKIANFPDDTEIYCGHEYTLKNLKFALTIEPKNQELQKRYEEAERLRKMNKSTIPSTLGLEKKTNPFLRAGVLKDRYQLSEVETFAKIRKLRDSF